jgi:hypothetical protein
MGYGRRHRRASYRYSYGRTRGVYSTVEDYLRQLFFELPPHQLNGVFRLFGQRYGQGPERYARGAFIPWKSGSTNMSQQTLDRLLECVPEVLTFEGKIDVYRKLRDAYRSKETIRLEVKKAEDLPQIQVAAERIAGRARSEPVPPYLQEKLSWLSQGDGEVARALVAAVEAGEGNLIAANVHRELNELRYSIAGLDGRHIVEHTIELPCGTIFVTLRPKAWRGLVDHPGQRGLQRVTGPLGLPGDPTWNGLELEQVALQTLTPEQVTAYQSRLLDLRAQVVKGQITSNQAAMELDQFLDQAQVAIRAGGNVEMSGTFQRQTGQTHIRVEKKFWMHAWFWIAMVACVSLAFVLMRFAK